MTPEQRKRFYFPIWSQTSARLEWRMADGRLVADIEEQHAAARLWPQPAWELVSQIIEQAHAFALNEQRAVTADDLRHALNWVVSGKPSCTKFSQKDLNQFDRACAVLRDPWDLTASMAWMHPAEDDRKRTLSFLRKLTYEARLIAIARNAWRTADVDGLSQSQLDWLVSEVKGSGQRKYGSLRVAENQPF